MEDIKKASENLRGVIHNTNLIYSQTFSDISGNNIYLKTEWYVKS